MDFSGENRVQPVRLGHVNIYLIRADSGYILVDTGMPGSDKKLDAALADQGIEPADIQLIIATHGHLDHAGSISQARRLTGGKVLCHRTYASDLAAGIAEKATPQSLKGRLLNLMTGLVGSAFEGAEPDILLDDELDLAEYGVAGKVIHTPGHSPSSISIVLDSGEALIGDLIRGQGPNDISFGMFYEDKELLLDSLKKVAACEPRIIYLCHGAHIDNNTLRDVIASHA